MPNIRRQQGFTLVEMAIVLVIIGLLLGGILKGQELITSARVRNIADQNSGVQAGPITVSSIAIARCRATGRRAARSNPFPA